MSAKTTVRNSLAALLRALPRFRGKFPLGRFIQNTLNVNGAAADFLADITMKDGSRMRLDVRTNAEAPAFWTGEYDAREMTLIDRFLKPGSHVLDVGANIGFWSVKMGRALQKTGGVVYAFEPMPGNFTRLAENLRMNGLEDVVRTVKLALSDQNGHIDIVACEGSVNDSGNAVLDKDSSGAARTQVRMMRLDDAAGELGIEKCDFIKVDIEGSELAFLKGAREFLARHKPPVHLELNYPWMAQFGWTAQALRDTMMPLGYTLYRERGGNYFPLTEEGTGIENGLLLPSGAKIHGDSA